MCMRTRGERSSTGGVTLRGGGEHVLQAGDTLILETYPSFVSEFGECEDFVLVRALRDSTPPRHALFKVHFECFYSRKDLCKGHAPPR